MQKVLINLILVVLLAVHYTHCEEDKLATPKIPEEIKDYLKALNEYYAIVGRPRFGRSISQGFFFRNRR